MAREGGRCVIKVGRISPSGWSVEYPEARESGHISINYENPRKIRNLTRLPRKEFLSRLRISTPITMYYSPYHGFVYYGHNLGDRIQFIGTKLKLKSGACVK